MKALRDQLGGGDRRSKGTADAIAAEALDDPPLVAALVAALDDPDELVRLRAADALEKASAERPEILAPHASTLLGRPADLAQHDVRWHIAQMIPRLPLDESQLARAVAVLRTTLVSESRVARTMALDALVRLADRERSLRPAARRAISAVRSRGSPAEQGGRLQPDRWAGAQGRGGPRRGDRPGDGLDPRRWGSLDDRLRPGAQRGGSAGRRELPVDRAEPYSFFAILQP